MRGRICEYNLEIRVLVLRSNVRGQVVVQDLVFGRVARFDYGGNGWGILRSNVGIVEPDDLKTIRE
jgi:hypothetical protein